LLRLALAGPLEPRRAAAQQLAEQRAVLLGQRAADRALDQRVQVLGAAGRVEAEDGRQVRVVGVPQLFRARHATVRGQARGRVVLPFRVLVPVVRDGLAGG